MSTHVVHDGEDTWVDSGQPSRSFGSGKWLHVKTGERASLLRFHNPAPHESDLDSAILRLHGVGTTGGSFTITLQRVADRWVEDEVTWNNQPGTVGGTATLTATQSVDGQTWDVDITTMMQTITNGAENWGFWITTTDTTEHKFYSFDALDFEPAVIVTWSDKPDPPTELVPSGGAAVSLAKPIVSANFHDPNDFDLDAIQVQIKATNSGWTFTGGFASPDFDSGMVATEDPELDLSTTSFGGISAGATKYMTMKWRNAAGRESNWSDVVHFTRTNKVSVTIDNPAVSPNNFVKDHTPELAHTVTGGTQKRARWLIYDVDFDADDPIWDYQKTGTDDTVTVPPGILTDEETQYREVLRIHDDVTRRNTPGDPVYVEVARDFTFVEDGTVDPVTNLTVTQVATDQPAISVEWDDATFPDGYTIVKKRDGGHWRVVEHDIDPASTFVSGIHHKWVDHSAAPNVGYTYRVRRRVNKKLGPGPTRTFTYQVNEIWLMDHDTGRLVCIVSGDVAQSTFTKPTVGATMRPVNAKAVVRLRQGRTGLEGNIQGPILSISGHSNDFWADNLTWMAERPNNTLRLILGDQNMAVRIDNIEDLPLEGGNAGDRMVKFDFWSLDGP